MAAKTANQPIDISALSIEDLDSLAAQIAERKAQLMQEKRDQVVAQVKELAETSQVPLADVLAELSGKRRKVKRGGSVAPKYRNPSDPTQTWAGRGKKPAWVREHLDAGGSLDELKISDAA